MFPVTLIQQETAAAEIQMSGFPILMSANRRELAEDNSCRSVQQCPLGMEWQLAKVGAAAFFACQPNVLWGNLLQCHARQWGFVEAPDTLCCAGWQQSLCEHGECSQQQRLRLRECLMRRGSFICNSVRHAGRGGWQTCDFMLSGVLHYLHPCQEGLPLPLLVDVQGGCCLW